MPYSAQSEQSIDNKGVLDRKIEASRETLDLQLTSLLCSSSGISSVSETVLFPRVNMPRGIIVT